MHKKFCSLLAIFAMFANLHATVETHNSKSTSIHAEDEGAIQLWWSKSWKKMLKKCGLHGSGQTEKGKCARSEWNKLTEKQRNSWKKKYSKLTEEAKTKVCNSWNKYCVAPHSHSKEHAHGALHKADEKKEELKEKTHDLKEKGQRKVEAVKAA